MREREGEEKDERGEDEREGNREGERQRERKKERIHNLFTIVTFLTFQYNAIQSKPSCTLPSPSELISHFNLLYEKVECWFKYWFTHLINIFIKVCFVMNLLHSLKCFWNIYSKCLVFFHQLI